MSSALPIRCLMARWRETFYVFGCGAFFFRVAGFGLHFSINSKPCFSERMGLSPVWCLGRLHVRPLRPGPTSPPPPPNDTHRSAHP